MNLKIFNIFDRGVANKERLQLTVLANTNLNYYAVFDTVYTGPNLIETIPKHTFWFTSYPVRAGDIVVLYTGSGRVTAEKRSDGGTNHFFHWGLPQTIWAPKGSCAVLIEISNWETSAPG